MKNYIKKTNFKGFTLVELLVAIGIMATLMAILIPNFMGARERARDAQKIQDLGAMKTALRLYYNDNQAYPTGEGGPLPQSFETYMPSIMSVGYTYDYFQTDNGDGFVACVSLESGNGNEDIASQNKCGVDKLTLSQPLCGQGAGVVGDKVYTVCAK